MRSTSNVNSPKSAPLSASDASRQRQILDRLWAEYARHVRELLRHRESIKGSVYEIRTRCGNPSGHCAKPDDARHPPAVRSWSEDGKTRIRSLPKAGRARIRRLMENYRRLRQSRASLVKLHREILAAVDRLERALPLPLPTSPATGNDRSYPQYSSLSDRRRAPGVAIWEGDRPGGRAQCAQHGQNLVG